MSKHARRRPPILTPRRRRLGATLATLALVATSATLMPANATTTLDATEPGPDGPVVRGTSLTINVDRTAMNYTRTSAASSNYSAQSNVAVALSGCKGDNPTGTNNSPRTIVTVTDPDGVEVLSSTSPVRDMSGAAFFTSPSNKPLAIQPVPSNTNYRGDFPGNTYHGMSATLDLTGKPAGVYTVTTVNKNMVKTTNAFGTGGTCTLGTPVAAATSTGFGTTFVAGDNVTTTTFEYRPWQATFKDVFDKGSVNANVDPGEFQFTVDGKTSPIFAGDSRSQQFYALPGADSFALPSDPQSCVDDPSSCLPSTAIPCDPSAGCTPRVMFLNKPLRNSTDPSIFGVFDLETKAFVAHASIDGTARTLMSLGTENDAIYKDLLDKLAAGAAAQGIDLASILATEVQVTSSGRTMSLSLLNGLQIDATGKPGGVQISSDATVQAGVILNVYAALDPSTCTSHSASSAESTPATDRFTRTAGTGYTVTRSDLLPEVPRVGVLGTIVGGPLYHIVGKFGSGAIANTTSALIGVDTAVDEPHGYPVWIEPFLSGTHATAAKTMDFLGTATWSASETSLGSLGCLVVDFMAGTGVAVLNNPLPVGLGTVFDPLTTPSPAAENLTDAVNDAVDQVVGQAAANPTVSALLTQVTALLPLA